MTFKSLLVSNNISIVSLNPVNFYRLKTLVTVNWPLLDVDWSQWASRSSSESGYLIVPESRWCLWVLHEWFICTEIRRLVDCVCLLCFQRKIPCICWLRLYSLVAVRVCSLRCVLTSIFDIHRINAVILQRRNQLKWSWILTNLLLMLMKLTPFSLVRYNCFSTKSSC